MTGRDLLGIEDLVGERRAARGDGARQSAAVERDHLRYIDVCDPVAIGHKEGSVLWDVLANAAHTAACHGIFAGVNER